MNNLADIPLSETVPSDVKWSKMTKLTEEVPWVDSSEQYFIRHRGQTVWHGRTAQEGCDWATANGIQIELFEPFEP